MRLGLLFFIGCALIGCANAETEETSGGGSAITATPEGSYSASASYGSERFRSGDVFSVEARGGNVTFTIVDPACDAQAPDRTCDAAWIDATSTSLARYTSSGALSASSRTLTITYDPPFGRSQNDEFRDVVRTFGWALEGDALTLTENASGAATHRYARVSPPQADPSAASSLASLDPRTIPEITSGPILEPLYLAMEFRRELYFHTLVNGRRAINQARAFQYAQRDFVVLTQMHRGGGAYRFFTKEGAYVGSFSGFDDFEAAPWSWSFAEPARAAR